MSLINDQIEHAVITAARSISLTERANAALLSIEQCEQLAALIQQELSKQGLVISAQKSTTENLQLCDNYAHLHAIKFADWTNTLDAHPYYPVYDEEKRRAYGWNNRDKTEETITTIELHGLFLASMSKDPIIEPSTGESLTLPEAFSDLLTIMLNSKNDQQGLMGCTSYVVNEINTEATQFSAYKKQVEELLSDAKDCFDDDTPIYRRIHEFINANSKPISSALVHEISQPRTEDNHAGDFLNWCNQPMFRRAGNLGFTIRVTALFPEYNQYIIIDEKGRNTRPPGVYLTADQVYEIYMKERGATDTSTDSYCSQKPAWVPFNVNSWVRVKLSERGFEFIANQWNKIASKFPTLKTKTADDFKKETDSDGYMHMQMHGFMRNFGDVSIPGTYPDYYDNMIFIGLHPNG